MNTATVSSSGTGPSPDALRNYLSERSRNELDALRSDLDERLQALENALTSPEDTESIETLVVDLARVAMDEAEASTRRAIFEAQADAQAQVDAARAEARTSIDAARTTAAALHRDLDNTRASTATLQKELDEARSALKAERDSSSGLQKDLQKTKTALESERASIKALRREVEQAQAALKKAEESARVKVAEAKEAASNAVTEAEEAASAAMAEAEEAASTALRKAKEDANRRVAAAEEAGEAEARRVRTELTEQLNRERATVAELTDAQAKLEPLLAAALNDADARSAEIEAAVARADAIEQRWKEAEQAREEAAARAEATVRERDTLALELDRARKAGQSDADSLSKAKQARQEAEAKIERAGKERDEIARKLTAAQAEADGARKERDAAARELKDARERADMVGRELELARDAGESEMNAHLASDQARQDAEDRANAAISERDALAKELEAATQGGRDANASAGARVEELNAERERLMREWHEDVVRLEVATRERDVVAAERDALAADLESLRQATAAAQAEERARQQAFYDAAEQRIRELELQLLQPQGDGVDDQADPLEPAAAIQLDAPPPAPRTVHDPPRRASRHAFSQVIEVQIDGSATQLVDLSTTGAQVVSPTALKPNRVVKVLLPLEDNPVSCRGKIMWARLEPPAAGRPLCYRAGLLFTSVDESSIQAFISHYTAAGR
jgi:chromosome segregation ATPase